tara:strand:+ start:334 stop:1062 length:729 start_codon:yes stop_codon:yes gene_type:complete
MKRSTINKREIDKFSKMAEEWWNPEGKFKPLHKFNPIRIHYIKENLIHHFKIKKKKIPLKNLKILDIGCGGGLLSEPMSRLGAKVTGIDASEKNIKIANAHLKKSKLKINYICASPEKLKTKERFDVILNMEIVEHVDDVELFIRKSSELLKKKGVMFVATLNKTLKSYIFAIVGAEYILRWLPIGTHEWEKFIEPYKLIEYGKKNSLKLNKINGITFDLLNNKWSISQDSSVNYIAEFKKY